MLQLPNRHKQHIRDYPFYSDFRVSPLKENPAIDINNMRKTTVFRLDTKTFEGVCAAIGGVIMGRLGNL